MTRDPDQPLPGSEDEERRYLAIRRVDAASPDAIGVLLDALADPSWRVRHVAAERLAESDPVRAVPLLVSALGLDSTPARRNAAAAALRQIGPAAVPALVAALTSSLAEFRTAAVEVLGEIQDRRAAGAIALVLDDDDVNARIAAAEALGKLGGEAAGSALHRVVQSRRDTPTLRAALEALAVLRMPPPVAVLQRLADHAELFRPALRLAGFGQDPAAFDLLATGLAALSRSAREAALQGLGEQRLAGRFPAGTALAAVHAAVPGLVALAASLAVGADDAALRAGALTVLQLARIPGDVHAIAAAADDERVRHVVAEALEALGPTSANALVEALPSLSPVAQVVVLSALARWGDARAFPRLLGWLDGDDALARGLAIEALGHLRDGRAVPSLLALLASDDRIASARALAALLEVGAGGPGRRQAVLEACRRHRAPEPGTYRLLAQLGEETDAGFVREGLHSPLPALRAAAAHALGAMAVRLGAGIVAGPELLDALRDRDADVRAAAAQALGPVARRAATSPGPDAPGLALAAALRDDDENVRAAAALALGDAGAREHAGAIAELARDPRGSGVAVAASVRALCELGAIDGTTVAAAATHPDVEVVKQAVVAAGRLPDPDATRLLVGMISHSRWDVRRAAAAALSAHRLPISGEALRRLARSERDPLVLEAIDASLRALEAGASCR